MLYRARGEPEKDADELLPDLQSEPYLRRGRRRLHQRSHESERILTSWGRQTNPRQSSLVDAHVPSARLRPYLLRTYFHRPSTARCCTNDRRSSASYRGLGDRRGPDSIP